VRAAAPDTPPIAQHAQTTTHVDHDTTALVDLTPVFFGTPPEAAVATDVQLPLYQLALAGSITTFFSDMIMHPMDSIKTIQQSDVDLSFLAATTYLWDLAGIAGFFHGFLTYAVSDAVSGALKFTVWEVWKQKTAGLMKNASQPVPVLTLFAGAALAFVACYFTLVPGELLKQQLQMSYYESLPEAIAGIYQHSGLAGFYTGYEAVLYRDVPYTMLELGLYEVFKKFSISQQQSTKDDNDSSSALDVDEIVAAAVTGAITAVLTTPVDSIKTLLMIDPKFQDASFAECFITTVQDHGPLAVFAGVVARVAWIVPFTAIYLPTYDALKRLLWKQYLVDQPEAPAAPPR
jgi:Mitochondrial carrier protein